MKRSQSAIERADILGPSDVAVDDDREQPALEMARIVPAVELELLGVLRVLAVGAVGSGLPPSAQTSRSIISFSGEEV